MHSTTINQSCDIGWSRRELYFLFLPEIQLPDPIPFAGRTGEFKRHERNWFLEIQVNL
jgi:hypothetical protein